MAAPTYVPDTALRQSQQGSSDLTQSQSPGSSHVNVKASEERTTRYFCIICGKDYAQRQGAWLHIRTAHNPNPKQCFLCRFRYARPYEYRNHLRKKHPRVKPDVILGKAPRSRRRATITTEYVRQQPPVSTPTIERDQQDWTKSRQNPSTPPASASAGVTSVSPSAVLSVDYTQPIYADSEQTVTMDDDKYAPESEVLDATYHLAMPLSAEERAELNDVHVSLEDGQLRMPSARLGGSTASDSPSNPEMAPITTHSPAVGENYGALVSEDPIVGSFGPMHYSTLSDAEIDATFDSIFNCTF